MRRGMLCIPNPPPPFERLTGRDARPRSPSNVKEIPRSAHGLFAKMAQKGVDAWACVWRGCARVRFHADPPPVDKVSVLMQNTARPPRGEIFSPQGKLARGMTSAVRSAATAAVAALPHRLLASTVTGCPGC